MLSAVPAREPHTLTREQATRFQDALTAVSLQVKHHSDDEIFTNIVFAGGMVADAPSYPRIFAQRQRDERQRILAVVERAYESAVDDDDTRTSTSVFKTLREQLRAIPERVPPALAEDQGIYLEPDVANRVGSALARAAGRAQQYEPAAYGRIRVAQDVLYEATATGQPELIARLAIREQARTLIGVALGSLMMGSPGHNALMQASFEISGGGARRVEVVPLETSADTEPATVQDERPERLTEMQECIDELRTEVGRLQREREAQSAVATLVRDALARVDGIQPTGLMPQLVLDAEQRSHLYALRDAVGLLDQTHGLESAAVVAKNVQDPGGLTFLDRAKMASVAVSRWAATESPAVVAIGEGAMFRALWVGLRAAGVRALDPQGVAAGTAADGGRPGRVGAADATEAVHPSDFELVHVIRHAAGIMSSPATLTSRETGLAHYSAALADLASRIVKANPNYAAKAQAEAPSSSVSAVEAPAAAMGT